MVLFLDPFPTASLIGSKPMCNYTMSTPTTVVGSAAIVVVLIIVVTPVCPIACTPAFAYAKNLAMVDSIVA